MTAHVQTPTKAHENLDGSKLITALVQRPKEAHDNTNGLHWRARLRDDFFESTTPKRAVYAQSASCVQLGGSIGARRRTPSRPTTIRPTSCFFEAWPNVSACRATQLTRNLENQTCHKIFDVNIERQTGTNATSRSEQGGQPLCHTMSPQTGATRQKIYQDEPHNRTIQNNHNITCATG